MESCLIKRMVLNRLLRTMTSLNLSAWRRIRKSLFRSVNHPFTKHPPKKINLYFYCLTTHHLWGLQVNSYLQHDLIFGKGTDGKVWQSISRKNFAYVSQTRPVFWKYWQIKIYIHSASEFSHIISTLHLKHSLVYALQDRKFCLYKYSIIIVC